MQKGCLSDSQPIIPRNLYNFFGKWHDLTWPLKDPKFNLHHLWEIFVIFN